MADQAEELESIREFCASQKESWVIFLNSQQTPLTPTECRATTCFQKVRLAELEEDNSHLRGELEEKVAKHEMESSAFEATITQLEEIRARLDAEVSRLTQDCAQQSLEITKLQSKLLGHNALAGKLQPRLKQQLSQAAQPYKEHHENCCSEHEQSPSVASESGMLEGCIKDKAAETGKLEIHALEARERSDKLEEKGGGQATCSDCLPIKITTITSGRDTAKLDKEHHDVSVEDGMSTQSVYQKSLDDSK
ncbi:uncharacterized protein LOC144167946 isoform X1 [Haemaphysalis longicornis]